VVDTWYDVGLLSLFHFSCASGILKYKIRFWPINLYLSLAVNLSTARFNIQKVYIACVCFVQTSEQKATFTIYGINRLVLYNGGGECSLRGTDWNLIWNRKVSSDFACERRADEEWKGKAMSTVYGICLRRKLAAYIGILIVVIAVMFIEVSRGIFTNS
jgi:hypothetical protein